MTILDFVFYWRLSSEKYANKNSSSMDRLFMTYSRSVFGERRIG